MITTTGCGRFAQDPELKEVETANKTTYVCNFTLAVDEFRSVNGEKVKTTSFFDFEAWDTGAKTIANYAKKGDTLNFRARPRQNKWTTPEGNRSKVVFRLEEFKIFEKRNRDDSETQDNDE